MYKVDPAGVEKSSIERAGISSGSTEDHLSILRNIKIGSFNIGSAFADILGSGVWNRIMIADLGFRATPVSLLLALNYFLAPLAIWAGQRSDHTNWRGYRRLPWVWGGRGLMASGFLLLAFMTFELAETGNNAWWVGIMLSFVLITLGYSASGSTYTTLIFERTPAHQRGRALGVVWTMLLAGFAFSGVLFSRLLPEYSAGGLLTLFITAIVIMLALWFFSIAGEERRRSPAEIEAQRDIDQNATFEQDFREVWSDRRTRMFFFYIGISFAAVFAQDQILEPFGGQVFDLSTGATSRFAAFWGTTALMGSVVALMLHRRVSAMTYMKINQMGLWTLVGTFALLTLAAFTQSETLLWPTLVIFGGGLGLWNIGTWGLMVSVTSTKHAGTYFGLWTMASLIFRGGGSVIGAIIRDFSVLVAGDLALAYGSVFLLEGLALILAMLVIQRISFDPQVQQDAPQEQMMMAVGADG